MTQPKPFTWSYSSLDLFKTCPHKYFRLRIQKDIVEPESEQMRYGKELHKAAEDFIKLDTPIPEKFAFMREALERLKAMKGEKFVEHRLGLTKDLTPCGFFDKDVWWRGIPDLLIIDGDQARLVDYKTGKSSKYADTRQLEILSLAIFKHFPQVKRVKAGLLFVVANDFVKAEFGAFQEHLYWQDWLSDVGRLEKAGEVGVWNPRPNFSCKGWCPVVDCTHNGRR